LCLLLAFYIQQSLSIHDVFELSDSSRKIKPNTKIRDKLCKLMYFNGDADGICALVQLRLAQPAQSRLVTGVKRDIQLLEGLSVQKNDQLTVLDISLKKNRTALDRILRQGAAVFYIDHHESGDIPQHPNLKAIINTAANTCTSLLVDQYLGGKYRAWAVTAAFGDNLLDSAEQAAHPLSLSANRLKQLKDLGVCINYNGYGSSTTDLHFAPDALYRELAPYASPFDFMIDNSIIYKQLLTGYADDMGQAQHIKPEYLTDAIAVYILPDEAWARRISGVFGNELANQKSGTRSCSSKLQCPRRLSNQCPCSINQ